MLSNLCSADSCPGMSVAEPGNLSAMSLILFEWTLTHTHTHTAIGIGSFVDGVTIKSKFAFQLNHLISFITLHWHNGSIQSGILEMPAALAGGRAMGNWGVAWSAT